MTLLHRYMLRYVIAATLVLVTVLASTIVLTQSLRFIDLIINRGVDVGTFIYLLMLLLPNLLTIVLPVALFIAVLFSLNRMIVDSEITVMRAAGMSYGAIAKPALHWALLVTALAYILSLFIMPLTYRTFKDMQAEIRSDYSLTLLQEGAFNNLGRGLTVYVRSRGREGTLEGIVVHENSNSARPVTIMAERGALITDPTTNENKILILNGTRQEMDRTSGMLSMLYFDSYAINLAAFQTPPNQRWREPSERFLPDLLWPDMAVADDVGHRRQLISEGHNRLAAPLACLCFAVIACAFLLSGDYSRRGQTKRIIAAVVSAAVVQSCYLGLQNAASFWLPAFVLQYLTLLIPIALGVFYLYYRPYLLAKQVVA